MGFDLLPWVLGLTLRTLTPRFGFGQHPFVLDYTIEFGTTSLGMDYTLGTWYTHFGFGTHPLVLDYTFVS